MDEGQNYDVISSYTNRPERRENILGRREKPITKRISNLTNAYGRYNFITVTIEQTIQKIIFRKYINPLNLSVMKRLLTLLTFLGVVVFATSQEVAIENPVIQENLAIQLPAPSFDSKTSVEKALLTRRSERTFLQDAIKLEDLSQILWAAQGVSLRIDTIPFWWTGEKWLGGLRTAPSAGALFPIELYIAVGNVENLDPGLYKYNALNHTIAKVSDGDKREDVRKSALGQAAIKNGPACIVIAANFSRTEYKYKTRASQYVYIESGAVCQNIFLQCNTLGIGTVMIGAIREESMKVALGMPDSETPIGVMPLGYLIPKEE